MKTIDMGGFENQEVLVKFAGKEYRIETDPPVEIYRKFMALQKVVRKLKTENDWKLVKNFIADLIGFYNDIDRKQFSDSLTKMAVVNFLNAYTEIITGVAGGSKKAAKAKTKTSSG